MGLSQLDPGCCSRNLGKSIEVQGVFEKGSTKHSNLSHAASVKDSFLPVSHKDLMWFSFPVRWFKSSHWWGLICNMGACAAFEGAK